MAISLDTDVVRGASNRMQALGIDVGGAITYTARHLESFDPSRSGGVLFQNVLRGHGHYTESTLAALAAARRIHYRVSEALDDVGGLFNAAEVLSAAHGSRRCLTRVPHARPASSAPRRSSVPKN